MRFSSLTGKAKPDRRGTGQLVAANPNVRYPLCGSCVRLVALLVNRPRQINLRVLRRAFEQLVVERLAPAQTERFYERLDRDDLEQREWYRRLPPEVDKGAGFDLFGGEVVLFGAPGPVEVLPADLVMAENYERILHRYARTPHELGEGAAP